MKFNCIYSTGIHYGLRQTNKRYKVHVKPDEEGIDVTYSFPSGACGLSANSDSSVKSMSLSLAREEALQLATAIMTALHHPTHNCQPVSWTTVDAMRPRAKEEWAKSLRVEPHPTNDAAIVIDNQTDLQIGNVEMDIAYQDSEGEQRTVQVKVRMNLPPTYKTEVDVDDVISNHGLHYLRSTVISVAVTKVIGAQNGLNMGQMLKAKGTSNK